MIVDPLLAAVDGVDEALDGVGLFIQEALGGEIGGIGDLAAFLADGGQHHALARQLGLGGGGLKEGHIVRVAADEGPGHHVELHRGIHLGVHSRDDPVLLHHVFQGHFRHAALASADDLLAFEVFPGKVLLLAPHQEGAVPAGELGEDPGRVVVLRQEHIDAGLRPRQADIGLAREHAGHHLVRAPAVHQVDLQALLLKEAQAQGHVLGRVEHRMGDFADLHGFPQSGAGDQQQHQQQYSDFLHAIPPTCFLIAFSSIATP